MINATSSQAWKVKSMLRVLAPRPYQNRKSSRPKEDSYRQPFRAHGRVDVSCEVDATGLATRPKK
jgi:hypothetical protein